MKNVFLSYSTNDHHFAELAGEMLKKNKIELWRDSKGIRGGDEWQNTIEEAISESDAVLVALSENSSNSPYVTFEWAYALGKGKPIIPLKLNDCDIHPRLKNIQYFDFSVVGALPWNSLTERITTIELDAGTASTSETIKRKSAKLDPIVKTILSYLNQRGFQMISFDRLRKKEMLSGNNDKLSKFVEDNSTVFRPATLKGNKPGLAKLIP